MNAYDCLKAFSRRVAAVKGEVFRAELWITPKDAEDNYVVPLATIVVWKDEGEEPEFRTRRNTTKDELSEIVLSLSKGGRLGGSRG